MKINVSTECEGAGEGTGWGLIARNDHGEVVQAWSVAREGRGLPVVAKTEAVRVALILAQQNAWRNVKIQVNIQALALCLQQKQIP